MTEAKANPWPDQVKKVVADRAYSLNYQDGVQCRFMPEGAAEGRHALEIHLEMTHSGHPFDLTWFVRYADDPSEGIEFELVAPPHEGGTLWKEQFFQLEPLRDAAQVLPVFMRGYFVGREAADRAAELEAKPD